MSAQAESAARPAVRAAVPPPQVPRLQAAREIGRMVDNPLEVLGGHAERLGQNYFYHIGGVKKVLVSTDFNVLKRVFKENQGNYRKSEIQVRRMGHFLGEGLLTAHGDLWRRQRRLIQKGFNADRLAAMAATMRATLDERLERFDEAAAAGPVDICIHLKHITFGMVARLFFSTRMDSDDVEMISDAITTIQEFVVRQIIKPYLGPWFVLSGELHRNEALRERCDAILLSHIRERAAQEEGEDDLLQILLDARFDDGERMPEDLLLGECMQILIAGHETSSTALSWTLYLLSQHPEYLRQAREEFDAVLGDAPLQFSDISKLKINNHILDEAMRLYPPFWMLDREAVEDDEVDGVVIPAGTTVIAFIHGAHHSAAHWDEPTTFRPERFEETYSETKQSFYHMPFGRGPRTCIGAVYAKMQMLMVLSVILKRYDFAMVDDAPVGVQPMVILRPKGGITMQFKPAARTAA